MITFTPHTASVTALGFSPDGSRLVSVSNDASLKLWDVSRLGPSGLVWQVEKAHRLGLNHAQFAPGGSVIYTGGSEGFSKGVVKAWNAANGTLRAETDPKEHPDAASYTVNAFVVSLCGKYLAYGGGIMELPSAFVVANASDLTPIRRVPGHLGAVGIFIAQEKGFVSGSADHTVRMWDWDSTTCHGTIKLRGVIRGLSTSRDGRHIAVAGGQIGSPEKVYVIDPKTQDVVKTLRGHADACGAMAVCAEGLASGGADKHVKFWAWDTGRCYHDLALRGIVRGLIFSPDGSRLAAAGGSVVMVWDMVMPARGKQRRPGTLRQFHGHTDQIQRLDFSPDGRTIASSAHDGTVRTWDVASGAEIRAFSPKVGPLHHVAFSPDGLTLTFTSDKGHLGLLDLDG